MHLSPPTETDPIRYLATNLPGHTLLVRAEAVGLLADDMALARLRRPTMLVIEEPA